MRLLDLGDRLRLAAPENVAAELRPVDQLLGELADRLQPAQALRQRIRHVLGAHAFGRMLLRQQQARFQVSEPRRHHQIIGGEFEPHFARRFDEGEVLVGQRQDGNLGEIDLLLPRQRQQKIERAFEALDVDHQRRLVGGALGKLGLELVFVTSSAFMRNPARAARRPP